MPKKKSAQELVADLAANSHASPYNSCHTCRLPNVKEINEVLREFEKGVENRSIKFGLRTLLGKLLVPNYEYPYQVSALNLHYTRKHHDPEAQS